MEHIKTLQQAIIHFKDFENCRKLMMELRWPDGKVACPHCGSEKVSYLEKTRVWKCYGKHPRPTLSLKIGTLFEELRSAWTNGSRSLAGSELQEWH